jgi:hypothetical protein
MAELAKAFDLSPNGEILVGSNPTLCMPPSLVAQTVRAPLL